MALTKAQPDSMAPKGDGQRPESNAGGDSIGMLGYSIVPFPSQKPARSNADVGITGDFSFTEVNEGTSLPAYDQQPETLSSETGS